MSDHTDLSLNEQVYKALVWKPCSEAPQWMMQPKYNNLDKTMISLLDMDLCIELEHLGSKVFLTNCSREEERQEFLVKNANYQFQASTLTCVSTITVLKGMPEMSLMTR